MAGVTLQRAPAIFMPGNGAETAWAGAGGDESDSPPGPVTISLHFPLFICEIGNKAYFCG